MKTTFTKMHGLGNDFIVFTGPLKILPRTVVKLCNRHTGIGADGVLVVTRGSESNIRMEYWNSDGSRAQMCGNGLRCVARYAVMSGMVESGRFVVETPAGMLKVSSRVSGNVEAQVGRVTVVDRPVRIQGFEFYIADVGNPHAITYVDDVEQAPVTTQGPLIELDKFFPHKTNVEYAHVVSSHEINLRIWERGCGETLACGTGMVATAVTSSSLGKTTLPVNVNVPGGTAQVWVDDEGYACMLAPAEVVFKGEIDM